MPYSLTVKQTEGKPGQVYYPLQLNEVPKPTPGPKQLLIKLSAAALNHRDLFIRQHLYPGISFAHPLLADGYGVVAQLGESCSATTQTLLHKPVLLVPTRGWESDPEGPEDLGKRYTIIGASAGDGAGTAQEWVVVGEGDVVPAPEHLSPAEGAALPLVGVTAWRALVTKTGPNAGKGRNVLVTGIGGGVALQVLQFAIARGCNVFVTSGIISNYGMTVGPKMDWLMQATLKNIELRGSTMGSKAEFRDMVEFVREHKIRPVVSRVVKGLDNIEGIDGLFDDMKAGRQFGKLVILIDPEADSSPKL